MPFPLCHPFSLLLVEYSGLSQAARYCHHTHLGSQLQSTSCLSSWSLADTKLSFCGNHVAELGFAIQFCMVPCEKHGAVHVLVLAAQHGSEHWLQEHILSPWLGSLCDWKQHTLSHALWTVSVLLKNLWETDKLCKTLHCPTRSLQLASLFVHCLCSLYVLSREPAESLVLTVLPIPGLPVNPWDGKPKWDTCTLLRFVNKTVPLSVAALVTYTTFFLYLLNDISLHHLDIDKK